MLLLFRDSESLAIFGIWLWLALNVVCIAASVSRPFSVSLQVSNASAFPTPVAHFPLSGKKLPCL